jgi:hypothetical protein
MTRPMPPRYTSAAEMSPGTGGAADLYNAPET